jgi:hypothetical protein
MAITQLDTDSDLVSLQITGETLMVLTELRNARSRPCDARQ